MLMAMVMSLGLCPSKGKNVAPSVCAACCIDPSLLQKVDSARLWTRLIGWRQNCATLPFQAFKQHHHEIIEMAHSIEDAGSA